MNVVQIPNPKNESEQFSFTFNGVYPMETTQEELFTNEGRQTNIFLKHHTYSKHSRTTFEVSLPRPGCDYLCIRCYRYRKDAYDAWRPQAH